MGKKLEFDLCSLNQTEKYVLERTFENTGQVVCLSCSTTPIHFNVQVKKNLPKF